MNPKKIESFKKMLLATRMDLLSERQRLAAGEKQKDSAEAMDSVDQADMSYSADYNMAWTQKLNRKIREVDEALVRIKEGSYGVCDMCGEDIPEGRLKVRPNARYCMSCKEDLEKKGEIK